MTFISQLLLREVNMRVNQEYSIVKATKKGVKEISLCSTFYLNNKRGAIGIIQEKRIMYNLMLHQRSHQIHC